MFHPKKVCVKPNFLAAAFRFIDSSERRLCKNPQCPAMSLYHQSCHQWGPRWHVKALCWMRFVVTPPWHKSMPLCSICFLISRCFQAVLNGFCKFCTSWYYMSPIWGKLEDQKMIDISWQSNVSVNLKPRGVRFVPTFVARLAWIGMKTTDTALLGHSGTVFLTASSLSDFWTSASGVFLNDTLLGSLCGQAYGAKNYDLVGIWLQVSLTVFSWVLIPVVIMWLSTAPILQMAVGTDVEVAKDAGCLDTWSLMFLKIVSGDENC